MTFPPTPPQTVGPYYSLGMMAEGANILVNPATEGERIRIEGRLFGRDGEPLPKTLIEIWQANAAGRYNHPLDRRPLPLDPAFLGFGRAGADDDGRFYFRTVKPGPVPYDGERMQAPHIVVSVYASGVAHALATRLYFADDPRTEDDPLLQRVPPERRRSLLATPEQGDGETVYRFDIVVRAENPSSPEEGMPETVFLEMH